jgi:regulatory protein
MRTVTNLKRIGQTERYKLTLDDGEEIDTTLQVLADLSLYAGATLSQEQYEQLLDNSALARCKNRALRILGARPMSEKELYDRLLEKGEDARHAEAVVAWLCQMHLLNDLDYGCMIVRHYAAKGYGALRIRNELYRRGVPRELWDEAFNELPETSDTIDRLLRSKLRSPNPDRKELKRATDALCRRGYSWGEIQAALERYRSDMEAEL